MPITSVLPSTLRIFEVLVLSITSHARLTQANEPRDYDLILKRTVREVKFFSETLLTILFFVESQPLVSQTLACLMFSLITYVSLESMSGDGLHKWIDEIPCGRLVLALMTKLPALSVLWTLSALALSQWNSLATKIVLCLVGSVLFLGLVARLRVHVHMRDVWAKRERVWKGLREVVGKVGRVLMKTMGEGGGMGRKRKLSDASVGSVDSVRSVDSVGSVGSGTSEASTDTAGSSENSVDKEPGLCLSGDECV